MKERFDVFLPAFTFAFLHVLFCIRCVFVFLSDVFPFCGSFSMMTHQAGLDVSSVISYSGVDWQLNGQSYGRWILWNDFLNWMADDERFTPLFIT